MARFCTKKQGTPAGRTAKRCQWLTPASCRILLPRPLSASSRDPFFPQKRLKNLMGPPPRRVSSRFAQEFFSPHNPSVRLVLWSDGTMQDHIITAQMGLGGEGGSGGLLGTARPPSPVVTNLAGGTS
jgi:hypothetical protein